MLVTSRWAWLADRVNRHPGGQFREEICAFLWHDLAGPPKLFQRVQRRRSQQKGDLIRLSINLLDNLPWIGGITGDDILAGRERWADDFFYQISLKNRHVQLLPRLAF